MPLDMLAEEEELPEALYAAFASRLNVGGNVFEGRDK
jgi:hypothetical protein